MYMGMAIDDPSNRDQVAQAEEGLASLHENELGSLIARFRDYYSLDGQDVDQIADQFALPSDKLETPDGGSVYCSIARAAIDAEDVEKLIHYDEWRDLPTVASASAPYHGQWYGT